MVPLKIGLVGLGGIGRRHLQTLSRLDGVRVTAVADVDGQRARSHAEQCDATGYADWQDLLARETIDALFVCTPPAAHAQPALAAFERGVHVFVEKPLARRQEDADAIASAARRSGLVCGVGYQWRAIDFLDDVREALADQEISFVIGRSLGSTRPRPWFVDLKEGGGILLELATHDIDLQRAIAGEVVAVQAAASKVPLAQSPVDDRRVENAMSLCLRFATGALGVINVAWTADGTPEVYSLDIAASEATLRIDLDPIFRLSGVSRGRQVSADVTQHPSQRNIAKFIEAVRRGDPSAVCSAPDDAAQALKVALACEQALASGETVPLAGPPAQM